MNKKKFTKLLALYLPYLVIGLAATNLGEAWRLAEGKELGDKIVSLMGTLPAAFANPLPSLHPLDILVGICCSAGLRLAVYLKSKNDGDVSEHERGCESMKDLTTQTGIIVKCSKTAIEFFQNAQSVDFFSALEIPKEFQDIAVEFYDLIMENDHLAALLGCRGNYDIAIQIDEVTGTMTGWHWFK